MQGELTLLVPQRRPLPLPEPAPGCRGGLGLPDPLRAGPVVLGAIRRPPQQGERIQLT